MKVSVYSTAGGHLKPEHEVTTHFESDSKITNRTKTNVPTS